MKTDIWLLQAPRTRTEKRTSSTNRRSRSTPSASPTRCPPRLLPQQIAVAKPFAFAWTLNATPKFLLPACSDLYAARKMLWMRNPDAPVDPGGVCALQLGHQVNADKPHDAMLTNLPVSDPRFCYASLIRLKRECH